MLSHHVMRGGGLKLAIAAEAVAVSLKALAGNPTAPVDVELTIMPGVIVGSNSITQPALDIGQFPTGSSITVVNLGSIQGAASTAGATNNQGGDAIKADYPNQTVTIINAAGASIYGAGGAGGLGGAGGRGGNGGNGYYDYWGAEQYDGTNYDWSWDELGSSTNISYGAPGNVVSGWYTSSGSTQYGNYLRQTYRGRVWFPGSGESPGGYVYHYGVSQLQRAYTSGGAGGNGGAGGLGGRGTGYKVAKTNGSAGSAGAAGSAGGTNAGAGGAGGNGGLGGNGGDWGQSGTTGAMGANGATGANGNNGAGAAGALGSSAQASGGLAGCYLKKGTANVTFNNSGTVAGRLA